MDEILRVATDDILYRLRQEEEVRADEIRRWRRNSHGGSIAEADHYQGLAGDAAREIIRLRLKLKEAGLSYQSD
jgi:hypothetical protein